MFSKKIIKDNAPLVECAFKLHERGLLPDTYILDLDRIEQNAKIIYDKAKKNGVKLFFMLKQIGRNPLVAKKLVEIGYEGCVCVDYRDAEVMMENNIPIAHLGHLVQVPNALLKKYIDYGVGVMTVFSKEKLAQIDKVAGELGKVQNISLRITFDGDNIYDSQICGFSKAELCEIAEFSKTLKNVKISAITTFPAFLFDSEKCDIVKTHNLDSLLEAGRMLEGVGVEISDYNAPSATCERTLDYFAQSNLTVGEPGHGLTGTTPLHAKKDCGEKVAYCYLTEVSHSHNGKGYLYGGGLYRRGNTKYGIYQEESYKLAEIVCAKDESIDYHYQMEKVLPVGTPVLLCARTQIFVTRSDVCVVGGISSGNPKILGMFSAQGDRK